MILKGSQRGNGQNLAAHLMRLDDNEHVRVHELRGFSSDDLHGAFKEAEATSLGTRCMQYLFSLSLSPPEDSRLGEEAFEEAIARIEDKLGLVDQPRAIVFHEKEGRRHAHCVWSRIDAETMTARPMPFFKNRLMEVSRELYLDHGWSMPEGMLDGALRNPTNFTLAEWQQAKRQGVDPRLLKQVVQSCWSRSDSRKALIGGLEDHGLFLAKGDRRGHVVLDHNGEVYALSRLLGQKTKDVTARLGGGSDLPSVDEAMARISKLMTPALRRHVSESRERFGERSAKLGDHKAEMTRLHRKARSELEEKQRTDWEAESRQRAARLPKGLRGLWHRITGKYQEVRRANELEAKESELRQAQERQRLIDQQRDQRAILQERFKDLRSDQARTLLDLRSDIGRFLKLARGHDQRAASREVSIGLRLER